MPDAPLHPPGELYGGLRFGVGAGLHFWLRPGLRLGIGPGRSLYLRFPGLYVTDPLRGLGPFLRPDLGLRTGLWRRLGVLRARARLGFGLSRLRTGLSRLLWLLAGFRSLSGGLGVPCGSGGR